MMITLAEKASTVHREVSILQTKELHTTGTSSNDEPDYGVQRVPVLGLEADDDG